MAQAAVRRRRCFPVVHSGDGHDMVQPGFGEIRQGLFGKGGAVPGQNGGEEPRPVCREHLLYPIRHSTPAPQGQPAEGIHGPRPVHHLSPAIGQKEDTFGNKGGDCGIQHLPGIPEPHHGRNRLAGAQFQQGFVPVKGGFAEGISSQTDRGLGTVIGFHRVITEGHDRRGLCLRQGQQRLLHLPDIQPIVSQGNRSSRPGYNPPPADLPGQQPPGPGRQEKQDGKGQLPRLRQDVRRQQHPPRKGRAKNRQLPHRSKGDGKEEHPAPYWAMKTTPLISSYLSPTAGN